MSYGLMAEFASSDALTHAVRKARAGGYKKIEAFSPFPIDGLHDAFGGRDKRIPFWVLLAGIAGGVGGFLFQYYVSVFAYPIVVGGKPLNSWPAFIPVTFELTILGAASMAVLSLIALNGLPMPYHPVFNVKNFERATLDLFFLCVRGDDPLFDPEKTRQFLLELGPQRVEEVRP
jgi:hypothetical protein